MLFFPQELARSQPTPALDLWRQCPLVECERRSDMPDFMAEWCQWRSKYGKGYSAVTSAYFFVCLFGEYVFFIWMRYLGLDVPFEGEI